MLYCRVKGCQITAARIASGELFLRCWTLCDLGLSGLDYTTDTLATKITANRTDSTGRALVQGRIVYEYEYDFQNLAGD